MTSPNHLTSTRSRSRPLRCCFQAVSVVLAIAACSRESGPESVAHEPAARATVVDSAGVTIVTSRGAGWASDMAWRLEPELQVGEVDGPLAFGRIVWVSPGPAGGMLVLDGQAQRVHVFDANGQHVREFGGEGDGPGEFRGPAVVTLVAGGRVGVAQGFPPVLHWLTETGVYLHSTRLPGARSDVGTRTAGMFGLWQITPRGEVFASAQVVDPGAASDRMPVVLMRIHPTEDAAPDTVFQWTWQSGFVEGPIRMFDPVHTWMPRASGTVVIAPGAPYEYREYDPTEGLQRVVRREAVPTPVSEAHREKAIADFRENVARGGAPADFVEQMVDRLEFESVVPAVMRVWVSEPDGRVWAGVYDPLLEDTAAAPTGVAVNAWDVFARDGAYLGRIPVPHGFRLTVVTEDVLYGVWEDELEVPYAKRYRIVRPA